MALFVRDGRVAVLSRYHRNFKYPYFHLEYCYVGAWRRGVVDLLINSRGTWKSTHCRQLQISTISHLLRKASNSRSDRIGSSVVGRRHTAVACDVSWVHRSKHDGIPVWARNIFDYMLDLASAIPMPHTSAISE
jgi:hypothetical protein